jgi:hypothetical protein
MDTQTLTRSRPRRTRQTVAQERSRRRSHKLAAIIERELDPHQPLRHGLRTWARIPAANRVAVAGPLSEIVALLRDPAAIAPERVLRSVLAFVTEPDSPVYGDYPNQAGFAAHALADELRARTGSSARLPATGV